MSTTNSSRTLVVTSAATRLSIDTSTHQPFVAGPDQPAVSTVAEPLLATNATVVAVHVDPDQEVIAMRLDARLLGVQEDTRRTNDLLNSRR